MGKIYHHTKNQAELVEKESGYELSAWLVTLIASLFSFYQFIQITMFNSLSQVLLNDFHLTPSQLGYLSSSYFLGSIVSLIPAGIIIDYFSIKRIIQWTMGMSMIALVMFSISTSLPLAILARFISGISGAFCFLAAVRIATHWFPEQRLSLVMGVIISVGLSGGIIAQNPITLLIDTLGWRYTLDIMALLGVIFLLLVQFFVQDFPYHHRIERHQLNFAEHRDTIWKVINKKENWLIGVYISLMNLPILVLGAMWGSRYLMTVYALDKAQAGLTSSMLFVGMIIGSPTMGWISDRYKAHIPLMLMSAFLLSITYFALFSSFKFSFFAISVLFLMIGILSSAQVLGYPLIASINSSLFIATAEGLASTIVTVGGLMQFVFGILLQSHLMLPDSLSQSGENYFLAMLIMPIGSGLSLMIMRRINSLCVTDSTNNDSVIYNTKI